MCFTLPTRKRSEAFTISGRCEAAFSFSEAVSFLSKDDHLPRSQSASGLLIEAWSLTPGPRPLAPTQSLVPEPRKNAFLPAQVPARGSCLLRDKALTQVLGGTSLLHYEIQKYDTGSVPATQ